MELSSDQVQNILKKSKRTDPSAPRPADKNDQKRKIEEVLSKSLECLPGSNSEDELESEQKTDPTPCLPNIRTGIDRKEAAEIKPY
jgi:hypothetical protein